MDVVSRRSDRAVVTIRDDFDQARCTDRYIDVDDKATGDGDGVSSSSSTGSRSSARRARRARRTRRTDHLIIRAGDLQQRSDHVPRVWRVRRDAAVPEASADAPPHTQWERRVPRRLDAPGTPLYSTLVARVHRWIDETRPRRRGQ